MIYDLCSWVERKAESLNSFSGSIKNPDGTKWFAKLFEVAMVILCIPHSNAVEECIFSQVKKNKTAARSNLGLDESVRGIVTTKLVIADKNIPQMEMEPELLNMSKLAAMKYNRAHRKGNWAFFFISYFFLCKYFSFYYFVSHCWIKGGPIQKKTPKILNCIDIVRLVFAL